MIVMTVQEFQMAVTLKITVVLVMLMPLMTVCRIDPAVGVVIFPMMNAVSVAVMIRAALTVQAFQMVIAGKVTAAV